ncbi:MAG: DNA polymerase IV [Chloroflexi bacterium]|nr:DNA polymerase IV [Chloroflexota bacterium]
MPRKILHLDLDAFFCAVEEKRDPSLRGKAFIVGGRPGERGVVLSASYAARKFGIRSAMPTARAVKLCPDLTIVPAKHGAYSAASQQVMDRLANLTPLMEQISIDEAFLDISDLPEPGEVIAQRLQASIRDELDLPCSIGIAANKLLAKTATDVGKASHRSSGPPYAILVVPPGQEAAFLAPLPVQALWGIGPKTSERMAGLGIHTIGDLASLPEAQLAYHFGKMGYELALRARGIDNRPVITSRAVKSISQETTFEKDVNDQRTLERTLQDLSAQVGYRLRRESLAGTTVRLKLRWSDFTTLTRQVTLRQATNQDGEISAAGLQLFRQTWEKGRLVRLLGVGVSGLGPALRQLSLWEGGGTEKEQRLLQAVDELRQRYGKTVIRRGKA